MKKKNKVYLSAIPLVFFNNSNMIIDTHFQGKDIVTLLVGAGFLSASILFFFKKRINLSILFLAIGGFIIRFFIIKLDPFIYEWDEQFHALVAKNMMTNPFKPMLYVSPVLPYNIYGWPGNHIWLHKGPVFLWLIAISYKLFGVNEIALRIPSVLMSTLMIPMIFRMGKLCINEKVGFFAAFLFATANYQLEMCSGIISSDHNDVAFMFFVCASFWALIEYLNSGKNGWIILIGLFSGLAVDTKWITGFLVFFCWLLTIICNREKGKEFKSYLNLIVCIIISLIICAPWYIYAYIRFPDELSGTLSSYSEHFANVVEKHSGTWYCYLDILGLQYGWITPFIILPSLYFLYKGLKIKTGDYTIILGVWLISVEIFYALAKTKMQLFPIIVTPVIYLALGYFLVLSIEFLMIQIKKYKFVVTIPIVLLVGFFNIGIQEIEKNHTDIGHMADERTARIHNTRVFKDVAKFLPHKNYVIFNCKDCNAVQVMFYTDMTAYNDPADSIAFNMLEKQGIKLAIFNDGHLPNYALKDSKVLKLNFTIY